MNTRLILHIVILIAFILSPSISPVAGFIGQDTMPAREESSAPAETSAACYVRLNDKLTMYPSVQAAVDASTSPTDIVKVAGTCVGVNNYGGLSQQVFLDRSLKIQGGYTDDNWTDPDPVANPTILDAGGLGRVMYITGTITSSIEGLHLTGGNAEGLGGGPPGVDVGGGIEIIFATMTISNCWIYSNTLTGFGGGIDVGLGDLTLIGNEVYSNTAYYDPILDVGEGGGLSSYQSAVTLISNTFRGNNAGGDGGAINLGESTAYLEGNTIINNSAYGGGGLGLWSGEYTLLNNDVISNTAMVDGGGILMDESQANITGNTFLNNTAAEGSAGGIKTTHGSYATSTISNNVFTANQANWVGAGLFVNETGGVLIAENTFNGNIGNEGAGITVNDSMGITITHNTLSNNTSRWRGGGLVLNHSQSQASENVITGNQTDWSGGGVFLYGGDVTLTNNAVVNNTLNFGTLGSGIYISDTMPVLLHTTVANNHAPNGDLGAVYITGSGYSVDLINTIIAHQATGIAANTGASATMDGVLWYSNDNNHTGNVTVSNEYTGDPQFIGDGYHITAGSYAIDRGVNSGVVVDIDGVPRPLASGYDIGADEYGDVPITGLTATNDSPTWIGDTTTLTATVATGTRVIYEWAFGDGSYGSGAVVQHIYPAVGDFNTVVTATNSVSWAEDTTLVEIIIDQPIEGLTAANDSPTELNLPTTLTATITAGTNVSYAWDFGDDSYGIGPQVQHEYPAVGNYTAIVTATNSVSSASATTTVIVDVPITGLNAINNSPTPMGQPTTLTAIISTGSRVSYTWDFGDDSTGSGAIVQHTYNVDGVYTAIVTATNSLGSQTAETIVTITFVDTPIAGLVATSDSPTYLGFPTTLSATVSAGTNVSYIWAFGDGMTGTGAVVQHTYPIVDDFTAIVTASNTINSVSTTTPITILPFTCLAKLNNEPTLYESVQDAVFASTSPNDVIKVTGHCVGVSYNLPSTQHVVVDRTLTIRGGYNANFTAWDPELYPTILDAQGLGKVVTISGGSPTLEYLNLTNGYSGYNGDGGGVLVYSGINPTIRHCKIYGNNAAHYGGAIAAITGNISVIDNEIYNNTAVFHGGGLYLRSVLETTEVKDNLIYGNHAGGQGGGLYAQYTTIIVSGNEIYTNTADFDGDGILVSENLSATITNNDVYENGGIGIRTEVNTSLLITDNDVHDNGPYASGISIYGEIDAHIRGNHVYGNQPNSNGAIEVHFGSGVEISENVIYDNQGEGILIDSSPGYEIVTNDISGNTESGIVSLSCGGTMVGNLIHDNVDGGVVLSGGDGSYIAGNSVFSNTLITNSAAGFSISGCQNLTFVNNMVVDNVSEGIGYGIPGISIVQSDLRMLHNTIARNTGYGGQGIYTYMNVTLWMTDTIIAGQQVGVEANEATTINMEATLWGADVWQNDVDWIAKGTGTIHPGAINLWGDPRFKDPTSYDYRIQPDSPAIDAGINAGVTLDIEGDPRPAGSGFDIGADESTPDIPIEGLSASNDGPTELGFKTTLSAIISSGNHVIYTWDFGDGETGSGKITEHVYPAAGVYIATLSASNEISFQTATTILNIYEVFPLPPAGGEGSTSDGLLLFDIPLEFPEGIVITYTPQLTPTYDPGTFNFAGFTFHLSAVDENGDPITSFSPPISLTLSYDEDALPPEVNEDGLELYRYDEVLNDWLPLPVLARDLAADTLTILLDHFSEFALFGPGEVKEFIFLPTVMKNR